MRDDDWYRPHLYRQAPPSRPLAAGRLLFDVVVGVLIGVRVAQDPSRRDQFGLSRPERFGRRSADVFLSQSVSARLSFYEVARHGSAVGRQRAMSGTQKWQSDESRSTGARGPRATGSNDEPNGAGDCPSSQLKTRRNERTPVDGKGAHHNKPHGRLRHLLGQPQWCTDASAWTGRLTSFRTVSVLQGRSAQSCMPTRRQRRSRKPSGSLSSDQSLRAIRAHCTRCTNGPIVPFSRSA